MSRGKTGLAAMAALALWAAATPSLACTPKVFPEEDYPPNAPGEAEIAKAYFDADEAGDNAAAEAAAQRWLDLNLKELGEGNWFVGTIYFNLGFAQGAQKKDAQALANFTKARDIFARTLGPDHARTRQAGLMLSVAQFKVGRYAEARATVKAVSQAADAAACPDSDPALAALKTWAQTAGNGEVVALEAAQAWGELAARRLRRFGPTDAEVPQYEIEQGSKLLLADRPAEAQAVFARAATRLEAAGPAKALTALNARTWEVEALLALGLFDEAETRIKAVMTAARRADPKAGETIDAEDLHLRVLMARADYGNAPKVAEDLLKSRIATYGEDNPRTLSAASLAASLYETLGQVATAERLRRILLDAAVREEGPDSDIALARAWRLADLINDDGRPAEAEAFLKPIWQRIEPRPTTETLVEVGNAMGLILRRQERAADAESLFRKLQRRSVEALGADAPMTLNVTTNLAIVLNDTGRAREAEALHREVWTARKAALGESHPDTLGAALNTARTINDPNRFMERVTILLDAQTAFDGKVSAAHPTVIAIMNTLVDDLGRVGRRDAQETLLTDMRKVYLQIFGADHPRTRAATLRLARAMGGQDKHAAAEPLFAELVAIETRRAAPGLPPTGDMIAASTGLGLSRTMQGRAREGYPSIFGASQAVYERSRDNRTVGAGSEESRRMLIENRYVFNALLRAGWAYAHEP